ncbi:MAG: hypothetical protein ABFD12_01330 [Syntrophorhabdus sp.]
MSHTIHRAGNKGRAGCGCLLVILVIVMVVAGLGFHPVSLKYTARYFKYEDRIFPADSILVPGFTEDKAGELYVDAFREYFAGNAKVIYIEGARMLGKDNADTVRRMAKERGIPEKAIKMIYPGTDMTTKTGIIKKKLKDAGMKKVIIVVPDYASRRYHGMYKPEDDQSGMVFMIKSTPVSYFRSDKWWRDEVSRALLARETYKSLLYYYTVFRKDTKL